MRICDQGLFSAIIEIREDEVHGIVDAQREAGTDLVAVVVALKTPDRSAVDVPPTPPSSGTPREVRAYVRDFIREVGRDRFLLAPGCDAPVEAKPENMQARCDTCRESGS
jgi:hypothetical protein